MSENGNFNLHNFLQSSTNTLNESKHQNKKSANTHQLHQGSKKVNQVHHRRKLKNTNPFDSLGKKRKKKPVKYENIRVKYSVFQELRKAQYSLNLSSRSKLIHLMYAFCKNAIYNTPEHKKRAKKFDKLMKDKKD